MTATNPSTLHEFKFHPEHDGTISLESAVFQALGYASVCWSEGPRGVFESDRAKDAGEALVAFIGGDRTRVGAPPD